MDIVFKGRHTDVLERFRKHATAKLIKVEKLDNKAIRVDVEVTAEHNPRQSGHKERVELTITTRGPAIRAEAAAEDRFAALDLALAKLESRLRRACDRRKDRHAAHGTIGSADRAETGDDLPPAEDDDDELDGTVPAAQWVPMSRSAPDTRVNGTADGASPIAADGGESIIPIETQGDGPLVIREKVHLASPMTIDQALFEMELVGHDFFLFTDATDGLPSVVYRRRGYQYGVIRLVGQSAGASPGPGGGLANGRSATSANLASG